MADKTVACVNVEMRPIIGIYYIDPYMPLNFYKAFVCSLLKHNIYILQPWKRLNRYNLPLPTMTSV